MFTALKSRLNVIALAATVALVPLSSANATTFTFNADPFAGSTALITPGRQVVGNELFIPNFNIATDVLAFDPPVFGLNRPLSFASGTASAFAGSNANFLVLQDVDADLNPLNGILNNAGLSANAIAASGVNPGAGFFIYFNTALNLNRLVYSTDLSSPTADLKILARFTNQAGQDGVYALSAFRGSNIASVPEAGTWAMLVLGFGIVGSAMRSKRRNNAALPSIC
jgi:PEP-CTERM motif